MKNEDLQNQIDQWAWNQLGSLGLSVTDHDVEGPSPGQHDWWRGIILVYMIQEPATKFLN